MPEKRRILQLSFPDMAAAEKAYAELAKAPSFEEAAPSWDSRTATTISAC